MLSFSALLTIALCLVAMSSFSLAASSKKKGDMNSYVKRTGAKFIEEMSKREGVIKLKSGMLVEILKTTTKADARSPTVSDSCSVTYSGTLKDGTMFDSGTTEFAPNQVIKGWTEALQYMSEGDQWKLYIPYDLAYGERGAPPKIAPFAPLVFVLEIHKVRAAGKSMEDARKMFEAAKAPIKAEDL
jgi:FKBP-type peptidyl-prolyl cis-trans isomerase FklB